MYDLYLMRHGRSLADDEEKCEGRYDSPLTDIGIEQAEKTAAKFQAEGIQFDCIISSTLQRAYKTAEIINSVLKTTLIADDLWMEKDNGILAGSLKKEVGEKYPLPHFHSPYLYPPENKGENWSLLVSRAILALNKVLDKKPGRYLVVAHGGILNAALQYILGTPLPFGKSGVFFSFGDNGIARLFYYKENNRWIFRSLS